jgi:hypothetical protein
VLIAIILLIDIIVIIVLIAFCWQIHTDLGISDNVWVNKSAAIAKQVEDLTDHSDQFSCAMQKGWLAYIRKTYSANADEYEAAMGQGESIVPDYEWLLWGPGLVCTINTNQSCSSAFSNNSNTCSNNHNNSQEFY